MLGGRGDQTAQISRTMVGRNGNVEAGIVDPENWLGLLVICFAIV
jgi:hypothetical protein